MWLEKVQSSNSDNSSMPRESVHPMHVHVYLNCLHVWCRGMGTVVFVYFVHVLSLSATAPDQEKTRKKRRLHIPLRKLTGYSQFSPDEDTNQVLQQNISYTRTMAVW